MATDYTYVITLLQQARNENNVWNKNYLLAINVLYLRNRLVSDTLNYYYNTQLIVYIDKAINESNVVLKDEIIENVILSIKNPGNMSIVSFLDLI